jgi:hypothetical protein
MGEYELRTLIVANRAFSRALHSLTHPIIIGAVALLLVNDHVLRVESPSWLTGKLGDLAWLAFAPIICALVVGWLVPRRLPQQERIVGLISFGFIGVWFALAKTVPTVHAVTITALDAIVGWHGTLGLDPTDLLTLPALLLGWYVWTQPQVKRVRLAPFAWVVLALGVMSTVASTDMPNDIGIFGLCQEETSLYAVSFYGTFNSQDGGLTWKDAEHSDISNECAESFRETIRRGLRNSRAPWLLTDDTQRFRIVQGEGIYRYDSNGREIKDFDLSQISRDVRSFYYDRRLTDRNYEYYPVQFMPGPFDTLIDEDTGNLVVAMGLDGVLVRTAEGEWAWAVIGPYYYGDLSQTIAANFLEPEFFAAGLLLLLLPPTVTVTSLKRHEISDLALFFAWFVWFIVIAVSQELEVFGSLIGCPILLCFVVGTLLNVPNIGMILDDEKRSIGMSIWTITLIGYGLFLLPYALWVRGTVPNYNSAGTFAFILALSVIIAGNIFIRQRFKALPKKKKPDELITMVFRDEADAPKGEAEGE